MPHFISVSLNSFTKEFQTNEVVVVKAQVDSSVPKKFLGFITDIKPKNGKKLLNDCNLVKVFNIL